MRFQFHYGAIKRVISVINVLCLHKFQFHYGAIKRSWLLVLALTGLINFNSIMVRLKDPKGKIQKLREAISIPLWCD